jgi:hypothetical protein
MARERLTRHQMIDAVPMADGESFSDWWRRCWHAGVLGDGAYGQAVRIARMRRGKYVRIPDAWRGKATSRQTIRKRASKQPPARELTRQERRAPHAEEWA